MKWAVVPVIVMVLNSIVTTIVQVTIPGHNNFMNNSVPGRTTAQLPSKEGRFGPRPSDQPIVVFNLGIQFNHPLGYLSPGGKEIGDAFLALQNELFNKRDEYGLLTMSHWRGSERESNSTLLMTFYFKDVESIHRLAHEDIHRNIWQFYDKMKPSHIGVFHETFCVPAKGYETMYVNCAPVLFGRGAVKTWGEGMEGDNEWRNVLVSADTPALKTQYARLSRHESGSPKERSHA